MRVLIFAISIFLNFAGFVAGNNQLLNPPSLPNALVQTTLSSPAPSSTTSVPYQTVTACETIGASISCTTHTPICSHGCNEPETASQPQPPLTCWTSYRKERECEATSASTSLPPATSRSVRMVANHARATTTDLGDRSQRWVAQAAHPKSTSDFGGRSQRWVAHAARSIPTSDLGGRSQRWIAQQAQVTSIVDQRGNQNGYVNHVTTLVTVTRVEA